MLDMLRIIAALFLLYFLPGLMFVQAMFPRKGELDQDFDWLYRIGLAIGLSIVLTIFVGFGLNSLGVSEETGMGYVTTWPIVIALLLLSLIFFVVGWLRGAFPLMGKLHPALLRFPPRDPRAADVRVIIDKTKRLEHEKLVKERFMLIKEIDNTEKLVESHSGKQRKYYEERREKLLGELDETETRIKVLESEVMNG
jgi:hypothetical protein